MRGNDRDQKPTPLLNDPESLARRLNDGYQRIERARELAQDTTAWEEFWIELLHQYEQASDEVGIPESE